MLSKLYSFVFKGLLTEEALDRSGREYASYSYAKEKEIGEKLSLNLLDEIYVMESRRMALVYTTISAFENTLRDFIIRKMQEEEGDNWWEKAATEQIQKRAEGRMKNEKATLWLAQRGKTPIYYTEFGDLQNIIQNNWTSFEVHFKSLDWLKQIISTLEKSRNVIMHSGQLETADIERIGMFIRDWTRQVGG